MSCFLSPCLQFSFPKRFLGPAWPHISWSLVSTHNPRSSILHSPQSTWFLQCHVCVFFVESDAQVTPTRSQNTVFWKLFVQQQCQNGKVCLDCAGKDGMHMSPSRGALRGDSKFEEKWTANKKCLESSRVHGKHKNNDSHWGQDGHQGGDIF